MDVAVNRSLLLAALLLAAPALHAQWSDATDDDEAAWMAQQAEATQAYRARIATALAASRDVRDQAFAEILRQPASPASGTMPSGDAPSRAAPRDTAAEARLRAIAARGGDDRLANQLLLVASRTPDSPERIAAARRWHAAEPDNLVPLLHAGLAADALLVEARRATQARTHLYDVVRWMASAFERHPLTPPERIALAGGEDFHPEEAAAMSAMAIWAASMPPAYSGLVDACRDNALRATPARAADCRHAATLLAGQSDTALDRMVGLSMLRGMASGNAERAAIDAQQRTMDWRMLQWGRIAQQQPRDGAGQFVRLLRTGVTSELELAGRVLQEAGVRLEPPAGWTPPRR